MPSTDYYNLLDVSREASQEEIKQAFRKLAHKYHPDKPGGDVEKFKEINAAYQVLGDPEKRRKYDQFGASAFDPSTGSGQEGFGGFSGAGFEDLGDLFGDMFGFGGGRQGRREVHGQNISVDLELSFREAVFGVERELTLSKHDACERCGGVGAEPGSSLKKCDGCGGSGVRVVNMRTILGTMQSKTTCQDCDGRGEVPQTVCSACRGNGVTKQRKSLSVSIPAGVEDSAILRLRGEGEAVKNGSPGDLFIRLHVKPDPRFERDGNDIHSTARIGFSQAALGDTIETETLDGMVELKVPSGTQSGAQFRLRGKGVPRGSGRGDQIVTVTVITPTKLSREQKRLLEDLDLSE